MPPRSAASLRRPARHQPARRAFSFLPIQRLDGFGNGAPAGLLLTARYSFRS